MRETFARRSNRIRGRFAGTSAATSFDSAALVERGAGPVHDGYMAVEDIETPTRSRRRSKRAIWLAGTRSTSSPVPSTRASSSKSPRRAARRDAYLWVRPAARRGSLMSAIPTDSGLHPGVDAVRRAEWQLDPRLVDLKRERFDLCVAVGASHREGSTWEPPCYDVFTSPVSDCLTETSC